MADNLPSVSEFRTGRADSTSSTSSTGTTSSNTSNTAMPTTSPTIAPRRRSGHLFEGLEAQKRSRDPASIARRQSLNEQRPKSGFLGSMWNNWVYGDK